MMWSIHFEHQFIKYPEATGEQIANFLNTWSIKLSEQEIHEIQQRQVNPFPKSSPFYDQYQPLDPVGWHLPQGQFPDSYIELLKYSNGGEFQNGERCFQFFNTEDLREMNLAYELPEYMPGAVSFAMDGCGNHYMFDMREEKETTNIPFFLLILVAWGMTNVNRLLILLWSYARKNGHCIDTLTKHTLYYP